MSASLQTLSLPEHGIYILVKKSGKCSEQDLDKALATKTSLAKGGQEVRLDKVLLKMGLVSPALLGEILPQVKKRLSQVKECPHCLKETFKELKVCVFCRKDIQEQSLKLQPIDPYSGGSKALGCANCGTQEYMVPRYCKACGADFGSGQPGPDSYCCKNCRKILMSGEAICPGCGTWAPKRKERSDGTEEPGFLAEHGGKLALALALAGIAFCMREPLGILLGGSGKTTVKSENSTSTKKAELATLSAATEAWKEAEALIKTGKYEESLASLDKLKPSADINSMKAYCYLQLSRQAVARNDRSAAKEHLKQGMKLDPGLVLAFKGISGRSAK